jgi:hypothetical protein
MGWEREQAAEQSSRRREMQEGGCAEENRSIEIGAGDRMAGVQPAEVCGIGLSPLPNCGEAEYARSRIKGSAPWREERIGSLP